MVSKGVPSRHKAFEKTIVEVLKTKVRRGAVRLKNVIGPNQKKSEAPLKDYKSFVSKNKKKVCNRIELTYFSKFEWNM